MKAGVVPTVTRRYAYAPKGQRVSGLRSGNHRPRTLVNRRPDRHDLHRAIPLYRYQQPTLFNTWLAQVLCPLLHEMHVMVMDNVLFHKSVHIHALITSTGATLLFLPPYSPDLNPIEHDCTTLKYLREYNEQDSLGTIDKMYK